MNISDLFYVGAVFLLTVSTVKLFHSYQNQPIQVLKPAMIFSLISGVAWVAACVMSVRFFAMNSALLDQCWYWTAVLSCCPLISVLGAQRPTSRVWTWFIILPLIAVLGWPAVTVLFHLPVLIPVQVQFPVIAGFALVVIMGTGNFLGTRFGVSAFLLGLSIMLLLWPFSNQFYGDVNSAHFWRAAASVLCGIALLHGIRQAARPTFEELPFNKLWYDFSDVFGIVWSMRIQDRINQTAEQEQWGIRLGTEGFVWQEKLTAEEEARTVVRLEQTLRWLLRRFVEPDWISLRLNVHSQYSDPSPQHASPEQVEING